MLEAWQHTLLWKKGLFSWHKPNHRGQKKAKNFSRIFAYLHNNPKDLDFYCTGFWFDDNYAPIFFIMNFEGKPDILE